uniref:Secreted protein n=1 Tax=Globodera pallida TaxID=36090 RepID=A0A183CEC8_GLOPA
MQSLQIVSIYTMIHFEGIEFKGEARTPSPKLKNLAVGLSQFGTALRVSPNRKCNGGASPQESCLSDRRNSPNQPKNSKVRLYFSHCEAVQQWPQHRRHEQGISPRVLCPLLFILCCLCGLQSAGSACCADGALNTGAVKRLVDDISMKLRKTLS